MLSDVIRIGGRELSIGVLWNAPEEMLADAYLGLLRDNLLQRYFHEGVPRLSKFLSLFSGRTAIACLVSTANDRDKAEVAGFGCLTLASCSDLFDKAEVSMAYRRAYQHPRLTLKFSQMMIDLALERLPKLKVFFGTIPEPNRASIMHAKRLGFDVSAKLDCYTAWNGVPCSAVVVSCTKEKWRGSITRREAKREGHPRTGREDQPGLPSVRQGVQEAIAGTLQACY